MLKGLLFVVIFALLGVVAGASFSGGEEDAEQKKRESIQTTVSQAEVYTNKLMYSEAKALYYGLVKENPTDAELSGMYADFCEEYGFREDLCKEYERWFSMNKNDKETACRLLELYSVTDKREMYSFMNEYKELISDTEIYAEIESKHLGEFRSVGAIMNDMCDWSPSGYAFFVNNKGKAGVISSSGNTLIPARYDEIVSYSPKEKYVAAMDNGQLVYLNSKGVRKLVPYDYEKNELKYYEYLGPFTDGFANVKCGDVWGYIDQNLRTGYLKYKQTTPFSGGVAAALTDDGWKFLNTSFSEAAGDTANEIYLDEYGYCCFDGMVYIKETEKWIISKVEYDENGLAISGKECSEELFDDVKPFGEYGAVKKNGKWGFVKKDGTWLIEPTYDDAYSFRCGLAPVKTGDKWGYISEKGDMVIDAQFDGAISFSSNGVSAVKKGDEWQLIQLEKYYYIGR